MSSQSIADVIRILEEHGCPNITDSLDLGHSGTIPLTGGGFGDIYLGQLKDGSQVAIKCARLFIEAIETSYMDFKVCL
jgi:predicted unusual protein kinase regulating ubiquinone biosynthesis (AarF/ABC1/UbiB family)